MSFRFQAVCPGFPHRTTPPVQEGYEGFVHLLKKHIKCGDIIQAVPSQRIARPTDLHVCRLHVQILALHFRYKEHPVIPRLAFVISVVPYVKDDLIALCSGNRKLAIILPDKLVVFKHSFIISKQILYRFSTKSYTVKSLITKKQHSHVAMVTHLNCVVNVGCRMCCLSHNGRHQRPQSAAIQRIPIASQHQPVPVHVLHTPEGLPACGRLARDFDEGSPMQAASTVLLT